MKLYIASLLSIQTISVLSLLRGTTQPDRFQLEIGDNIHGCPVARTENATEYVLEPSGKLAETSYMVHSQQMYDDHPVMWMGSDKKQNELSAVDLVNGNIIRSYKLDIERRGDWESIGLGPCSHNQESKTCIYIGNTGNNDAKLCTDQNCSEGRDRVQVYKFEEPDLSDEQEKEIHVWTLRLNYHNFGFPTNRADSESLFVDPTGDKKGGKPGDIYLITKFKGNEHLQRLAKVPVEVHGHLGLDDLTSLKYSLEPAGKPFGEQLWTGADINQEGNLIAIRDYDKVYFFPRPNSLTISEALEKKHCPFISETKKGPNGNQFEAVAMIGGKIAEASECPQKKKCPVIVRAYDLQYISSSPSATPSTFPTNRPSAVPSFDFHFRWDEMKKQNKSYAGKNKKNSKVESETKGKVRGKSNKTTTTKENSNSTKANIYDHQKYSKKYKNPEKSDEMEEQNESYARKSSKSKKKSKREKRK